MKRCPQCEFIYEDDQSLCDMDGILLVFDSQQLPKQATSVKQQARNRLLPTIAALLLTTVLFLVYYVSTHQRPLDRSGLTPVVSGAQPAALESTPPSANPPEMNVAERETVATPEVKESATKTSPVSNAAKKPERNKTRSVSAPKVQNSTATQKDDSKIGSFMKKTGRLLKKPFKF